MKRSTPRRLARTALFAFVRGAAYTAGAALLIWTAHHGADLLLQHLHH